MHTPHQLRRNVRRQLGRQAGLRQLSSGGRAGAGHKAVQQRAIGLQLQHRLVPQQHSVPLEAHCLYCRAWSAGSGICWHSALGRHLRQRVHGRGAPRPQARQVGADHPQQPHPRQLSAQELTTDGGLPLGRGLCAVQGRSQLALALQEVPRPLRQGICSRLRLGD